MAKTILPHLPQDRIVAAFARSRGNEIASGKFDNPESSAALAANAFGHFLNHPEDFPALPGTESWGWPAREVQLEFEAPFPWWPRTRRGHPWLDCAIITQTHLIGVESKRYEPFRGAKGAVFSETYWRDVWGDEMDAFLAMRDWLRASPVQFAHLDAAQLVKHAFGLRTEAARRGLRPALIYLFAEPERWPNGKRIEPGDRARHREEVKAFAHNVSGAEVAFLHLSYKDLLVEFERVCNARLRHHVRVLREWFPDI